MSQQITQRPDGSWLYQSNEPFLLESGESLPSLELVYETWGELSPQKDNVIVVHHALSVGAHVSKTPQNTKKGWWNDMVGEAKPINSNEYFVICINNLGSCFGSSGPVNINPQTERRYNAQFPEITIGDMVNSQKQLLDYLQIAQLYAIIGNSMGAMLSLTWAIEYPDSVERVMLSCTAYKAYPANIANRNIQQSAIRIDPAWNHGDYQSNESLEGFKLARKLGLFSYRNSAEWNRRFNSHLNSDTEDMEITRYMDYNAQKFVKTFDANSYLTITTAMDHFDVTKSYPSTRAAFEKITAKVVVISEEFDILFTPQQQRELFACLQDADVDSYFITHQSQYGHDAFLVEIDRFGNYICDFLQDKPVDLIDS
ncbi:homoserine O-acetyltransferase MetX [Aliikangiella maris]|uniref:Homoserine O-acetyltransferase n=2 Tax=Aliikangiella maris TaxID=3162458 RepID=A0ABV2BYE9_9GAMM